MKIEEIVKLLNMNSEDNIKICIYNSSVPFTRIADFLYEDGYEWNGGGSIKNISMIAETQYRYKFLTLHRARKKVTRGNINAFSSLVLKPENLISNSND